MSLLLLKQYFEVGFLLECWNAIEFCVLIWQTCQTLIMLTSGLSFLCVCYENSQKADFLSFFSILTPFISLFFPTLLHRQGPPVLC